MNGATKEIRKIGITGGIGSGKSEVTNYLCGLGYHIVDADEIAREVSLPGQKPMLKLRKIFGEKIFLEDGNLNRSALAKMMFEDLSVLGIVNEIFHTEILGRIEAQINKSAMNGDEIVFVSAPLLFETNADIMTDESWLITADEDVRLARVINRDGLTEADIRARMRNQMPEEEKRKRADFIIENNGTLEQLYKEIDDIVPG